jgi:hypothetical protein
MTSAETCPRTWTRLGQEMGYTDTGRRRGELLAAISRLAWKPPPSQLPHLEGPAVRAIVWAVQHCNGHQLHRLGAIELHRGCQLVGLEDSTGTRLYLLGLGIEAIHVLTELPPHSHTPTPGRSK